MAKVKSTHKKRVLIVDDDEVITDLEKEILGCEGFKIEIARDGIEGLKKIKQYKYDVIISDFEMPRMKGNKFYLEVKKLSQGLEKRIIFASGSMDDFMMSTGNRILAKPFSPEQLIEAVKDTIKSV